MFPLLFPKINVLYDNIIIVLVSIASSERSFKTLNSSMYYIRNSTRETRLTGLVFMSIHWNILIKCNY